MRKKKEIRVYGRISTRERALNGYGLDMQITKNIEYLKLFDLYENANIKVYRDDGYSAKSMKRPAMNELLQEIEDRKVDIVIIYKLDRLSRNVVDVYSFIKMLMDNECNLISVVDNMDVSSANGRMIVGILAIIAQWELETDAERAKDALVQMASEGKYPVGHTPYGYLKKDNKLYIKEEEAKFVRRAYELTINGMLPIQVYKQLKLEGFDRNYNDETAFIKRLLQKEYYHGWYSFKGKEYLDIVPAIVSKEVAIAAASMMNKRYKNNNSLKYYFGYKVRCSCGEVCECKSTKKQLTDNSIVRYYYYYCEKCKERINQEDVLSDTLYRIHSSAETEAVKKDDNLKRKQLNKINKKIDELYDEYLEDTVDYKNYLFALGKLQLEKDRLIKILRISIDYNKIWLNMTHEERRLYIHKYVGYVIIDLELKQVLKLSLI